MSPSRQELERLYSREPDGVLIEALQQGSGGYTPESWAVITREAARRGIQNPPEVPAGEPARVPLTLSLTDSQKVMLGRIVVSAGAIAWFRQVLHYLAMLSPRMPPVTGFLLSSWPLARLLVTQSLWGFVALAAGFVATRTRFMKLGQVLMVISLGLIIAESIHYVSAAHHDPLWGQ